MARPGEAWRNAALGPRSPFALRFLAVVVSAGLLLALLIFGAVQGALGGGWRYRSFWLLVVPAAAAFVAALAGRPRHVLMLVLAALLLAGGMVLVGR